MRTGLSEDSLKFLLLLGPSKGGHNGLLLSLGGMALYKGEGRQGGGMKGSELGMAML